LSEVEAGVFEASFAASLPGIYQLIFRAEGETWHGCYFIREELRTAAVWHGGDNQPPTTAADPSTRDEQLCEIIKCILNDKGVVEFLRRYEIDVRRLSRCLRQICRTRPGEASRPEIERPGRVAPGILSELRTVLGDVKTNDFLSMISQILDE